MPEPKSKKPPVASEHITDDDYALQVTRRLGMLLDNKSYSDVVLKVGEKEFSCHKVLLAAASTHFDKLFRSGTPESLSGVIELEGEEIETVSLMLDFIYKSKVDITSENSHRLLQISQKYEVAALTTLCDNFMVDQSR